MAQLTLEMPESAFATLHPRIGNFREQHGSLSTQASGTFRLLPASRVGVRGICAERARLRMKELPEFEE